MLQTLLKQTIWPFEYLIEQPFLSGAHIGTSNLGKICYSSCSQECIQRAVESLRCGWENGKNPSGAGNACEGELPVHCLWSACAPQRQTNHHWKSRTDRRNELNALWQWRGGRKRREWEREREWIEKRKRQVRASVLDCVFQGHLNSDAGNQSFRRVRRCSGWASEMNGAPVGGGGAGGGIDSARPRLRTLESPTRRWRRALVQKSRLRAYAPVKCTILCARRAPEREKTIRACTSLKLCKDTNQTTKVAIWWAKQ